MFAEKNKTIGVNCTEKECPNDRPTEDCSQEEHKDIKEIDDKLVGDDRDLAEAEKSNSIDNDNQKEPAQNNNY